jgi:hypothetical protein
MAEANAALEAILAAHLPYPALVVDRQWELVAANDALYSLLGGLDADLLEPPVNVIRLSIHLRGLAPRIVNLAEWRLNSPSASDASTPRRGTLRSPRCWPRCVPMVWNGPRRRL